MAKLRSFVGINILHHALGLGVVNAIDRAEVTVDFARRGQRFFSLYDFVADLQGANPERRLDLIRGGTAAGGPYFRLDWVRPHLRDWALGVPRCRRCDRRLEGEGLCSCVVCRKALCPACGFCPCRDHLEPIGALHEKGVWSPVFREEEPGYGYW